MTETEKPKDALDTLGTVLADHQPRDAVHVATVCGVAATPLAPGTHVGPADGRWSAAAARKLGVVDPFLKRFVKTGELFWVLLYPKSITSLRHAWTHPDLPDEGAK